MYGRPARPPGARLAESVLHSGGCPESIALNCARSWPILDDKKNQAQVDPGLETLL